LLCRAIPRHDGVLIEREKSLERCASEGMELHPELLKEFYGNTSRASFSFLSFMLWFCGFAVDNVDGFDNPGIKIFLDPDSDFECRSHTALVLADRAPGYTKNLAQIA